MAQKQRNEIWSKDAPLAGRRIQRSMDLLERAANRLSDDTAPDPQWWKDYFLLTGQHMVLTEEGWQDGSIKKLIGDDKFNEEIIDEVNAPKATA